MQQYVIGRVKMYVNATGFNS